MQKGVGSAQRRTTDVLDMDKQTSDERSWSKQEFCQLQATAEQEVSELWMSN